MVLQLVRCTATPITRDTGGLLPHLSPLFRERNGYFLLHYCPLSETFPLRSTMPCVARTFLSPSRDSDRTACLYILDLMILDFRFQPHKANALTTPSNSPLHRGRTRFIVTLKQFLAFGSPPVQGRAGGGSPL